MMLPHCPWELRPATPLNPNCQIKLRMQRKSGTRVEKCPLSTRSRKRLAPRGAQVGCTAMLSGPAVVAQHTSTRGPRGGGTICRFAASGGISSTFRRQPTANGSGAECSSSSSSTTALARPCCGCSDGGGGWNGVAFRPSDCCNGDVGEIWRGSGCESGPW